MRLLTYEAGGRTAVGVRTEAGVVPAGYDDMLALIRDGARGLERAREAAASGAPVEPARLLAPLPRPGKILCAGINYLSHKDENPEAVLPSEPFFFSKLPTAVIAPGEPIVIPAPEVTTDYEVELAMVIGARAKGLREESALDCVFGWTVLNDVSARSIQFKESQITLGKGVDTFAPLGPEIVTADELGDPLALRVSTTVNGERRQDAATSEMLFPPARLLAFLTRIVTLEPGDVVSTGTPAGVAAFMKPPAWLAPGDVVAVSVDRIGTLENPVVAGW